MRGINHVGLALAATATYSNLYHPALSIMDWGVVIIGSLLPDIDNVGTVARPSNFLPKFTPRALTAPLDWLGTHLSKTVRFIFGHRGMIHYPALGVGLIALGMWLKWSWLVALGAGYLLHLAGDIITIEGVPLLGPLTTKKISLLPLRVGSFTEGLVGWLCWLVAIGLILSPFLPFIAKTY